VTSKQPRRRTIHIDRKQEVEGPLQRRQLPQDRTDCLDGIRPCPYVTCRFNLYLDVTPGGSILLNYPGLEVWEVENGLCALDHAAEGKMNLGEIGRRFNLTRERIRQIETIAKGKLRDNLDESGLGKALLETVFELERGIPSTRASTLTLTGDESPLF